MSGVRVIAYLLENDSGVLATVAAERIFAGVIPQGTVPAIGAAMVSSAERKTVSMAGAKKLRTERVEVTIKGATYAGRKAIVELVRAACANRHGTVNGVDLDSIHPAGEGPDDDDPVAQIFTGSIDYMVKWRSS